MVPGSSVNLVESFGNGRGDEFRGHQIHGVSRYHPAAGRIPRLADVERHIEPERIDTASVFPRNLYQRLSIAPGQIRRIHPGFGAADFNSLFEQETHGGKHIPMYGLIALIVRQLEAYGVA